MCKDAFCDINSKPTLDIDMTQFRIVNSCLRKLDNEIKKSGSLTGQSPFLTYKGFILSINTISIAKKKQKKNKKKKQKKNNNNKKKNKKKKY